ncbi:hypothetical protein GIB67_041001 [Kingdonia uniflora]|uniref:Uncharacterized protein n=1 Tax=Kingdonia uniflora TaxID=39325 RepID=A0A7J7NBV7_9MAGN|nr:hypothetical protein GIB67_041001 [Kingdonia uniflora]
MDQFYYQGLLEYIMSDVVEINEAISPGSGIEVKILHAENTKRVKKPKASELREEELDDLPHMYFSDDEHNIEFEGGVGLGGDAPINAETEAGVGLRGEASNNIKEVDEVDTWNRWAKTNPDSLDGEIWSGQSSKNANAQWVVNEVKETIRALRTTRPAGVKEMISRRYGVDISYYTLWNPWTIYMERIVGSYDEGYILQPKFMRQVLLASSGSLAKCSKDL